MSKHNELDFANKNDRVTAIGKLTRMLHFYQQEELSLEALHKPFDKAVSRYNHLYCIVPRRFRNRQDALGYGMKHEYVNRSHPVIDSKREARRNVEALTNMLQNLPNEGKYRVTTKYVNNSGKLLDWVERIEAESQYLERVVMIRRTLYALGPFANGWLAYVAFGLIPASIVLFISAYLAPTLYDKCR